MTRHTTWWYAYLLAGVPAMLLTAPTAHAIANYPDLPVVQEQPPGYYGTEPDTPGGPGIAYDSCPDSLSAAGGDSAGSVTRSCSNSFNVVHGLSVRMGRRVGASGEIIGELDGIRVDYRLSDGLLLNGIAGYPVQSSTDSFNATRRVIGMSAATSRFAGGWDLNGYVYERQENGGADAGSMGVVVRKTQPRHALLVHLDHDAASASPATTTASAALRLRTGATLSATFDQRDRLPSTMQQNYLQQTTATLEGWSLLLPGDRLAQYTQDVHGGTVSTLAVGLSHALSRRLRLSSDLAVLEAGADSAATAAQAGRAREYLYHSRLSGKDLLQHGDSGNLDVRHSVGRSGRRSSVTLDNRYRMARTWDVTPRLRLDYQDAGTGQAAQRVIAPALKLEYRRTRQAGVQIEAGGEWTAGAVADGTGNGASCYVSLGFRTVF